MKIKSVTNEAALFTSKYYAAKVIGVEPSQCYFVWFCKTLQNFKALISTDAVPGKYVEITYNGDKDEMYVDKYEKESNSVFSDPTVIFGEAKDDKD